MDPKMHADDPGVSITDRSPDLPRDRWRQTQGQPDNRGPPGKKTIIISIDLPSADAEAITSFRLIDSPTRA